MINYYETLGVEPSASAEEIKTAYRTLAKRLHPDVAGGDPVKFARTSEAYEVLSEPARRKAFDDAMRAHTMRRDERFRPKPPQRDARWSPPSPGSPFAVPPRESHPREGARPAAPPPEEPGPPLTRLMSLTLPAGGRFLLEGLNGEFIIQPTSADDLWETTRQKFKGEDPAELARRVVQIRVYGPRELVKQLKPTPTTFGLQLQGVEKDQFPGGGLDGDVSSFVTPRGFHMEQLLGLPVKLTATVPVGSAVYLYDLTGKITVGDLRSELVANLDERTFLRVGAMSLVNINMNGRSRAHLTRLEGEMDAILFGQSQMLVEGHATRLRAVLEHEAHLEAKAEVDWLQATVGGRAYLNGKGVIDRAHCDVRAAGYVRLAKVRTAVQGTRTGSAGFDVIEGPPPQNIFGNVSAAPPRGFPGSTAGKRPDAPPRGFPGSMAGERPDARPAAPTGHGMGGGSRLNFGMGPMEPPAKGPRKPTSKTRGGPF